MKLLFQSPAFPIGKPDTKTKLKTAADERSGAQPSIRIRILDEGRQPALRVYLEQGGQCEELVPRAALPQNQGMLIGAIAHALQVPEELVASLEADERRIIGILILEGGRFLPACDLAFALSGSFRGVTDEYVAKTVESINGKLSRRNVPISVQGNLNQGFRLPPL